MIICGVDPGLSGAVCFYNASTGDVETIDMPSLTLQRGGKSKSEVDPHALAGLLWKRHCDHAFVEKVGAMPGQGTSSMFSFGKSYGVVLGVIAALGIPLTLVSPVKWKRTLGVTDGKDGARARASQLMPAAADQWSLKKDHGKAESALLALYGHQTIGATQ